MTGPELISLPVHRLTATVDLYLGSGDTERITITIPLRVRNALDYIDREVNKRFGKRTDWQRWQLVSVDKTPA